jgi:hypothetical protein
MSGLQFSQFLSPETTQMENSARAIDMALGDFNPQTNIDSNLVPTTTTPHDETLQTLRYSSTQVVPYTSKLEQKNQEIPSSFDDYIGPPFKPIHVREIYDQIRTPNDRKRLTEDEIQAIVQNPNKQLLPQLDRLQVLSDEANEKRQTKALRERFYNLSLQQILENIVGTVGGIVDDIITYRWSGDPDRGEPGGFEGILQIFTKQDRLIYIGLIVTIFAILVILIRETDG